MPYRALSKLLVALVGAATARAQVDDPIVVPVPAINLAFGLETVSSGMIAPNWGESAPGGDPHVLYIALGDGGGADDQGPGHGTIGNGQNPGTVLGAILRIDPASRSAPSGRYGVPSNNPFVLPGAVSPGGAAGCLDGFCDEIFAYGFRNPYRMSFDRASGTLIAADVGQHAIEEVNVVRWGGNYGWNRMEGSYCFNPNGNGPGFVEFCFPGPAGLIGPSVQYDHDEGSAIIGGFVYRGPQSERLQGIYIFGDYARTLSEGGRIFVARRALRPYELRFNGRSGIGVYLLGFAEDGEGNVYILGSTTGGPTGISGVLLRPQVPLF